MLSKTSLQPLLIENQNIYFLLGIINENWQAIYFRNKDICGILKLPNPYLLCYRLIINNIYDM
jgi:hypothetical protein